MPLYSDIRDHSTFGNEDGMHTEKGYIMEFPVSLKRIIAVGFRGEDVSGCGLQQILLLSGCCAVWLVPNYE